MPVQPGPISVTTRAPAWPSSARTCSPTSWAGPMVTTGRRFARYEERMRPFVALNQALATENPGGPPAEESSERAKNAISLDQPLTTG